MAIADNIKSYLAIASLFLAAGSVFGQSRPNVSPEPLKDSSGNVLPMASQMQFQFPVQGAVPRTLRSRLSDDINIADFGAKCDGVTDDFPAIQAAIRAASSFHGATLKFPLTSHPCGIKHSIDLPGEVVFRGQGPSNASGLIALAGGTWSTYVDDRNGAVRTYMVSIGGGNTAPHCKTAAVSYSAFRDMIVSAARMVQTAMLNQCGEEQSGFHNILTGGGTYAQIVVQTSGAENSGYDDLYIFPLEHSYGIVTDVNSRVVFARMTINGGLSDGVLVYGSVVTVSDIHCEHVDTCIHLLAGGGVYASNVDSGPAVDTASVVIGKGAFGAIINVMTGQNAGGAAVPFVKDELMRGGATLLNFGGIGYYYSYMSNNGHTGQLITSDPNVAWILPSGINVPSLRSNFGTRFVCIDTSGKLISQPAPCSGN